MIQEYTLKNLRWVDVTSPSNHEIEELIQKYSLPPLAVEDALEPEHLPKIEKFENATFLIFRHYDSLSQKTDATVNRLTRKVAFFLMPQLVITIHRSTPDFWEKMVLELTSKNFRAPEEIFLNVFYKILDSYDGLIQEAEKHIEILEGRVFSDSSESRTLEKINLIKKRLSVLKHVLANTHTVLLRIPQEKSFSSLLQDIREDLEGILFRVSSLVEESNSLLQLYLSLATHRANDIMKVLTIFSAFFMPLTFIVGVYGMNFEFMPELHWKYGYLIVWIFMIAFVFSIYFFFKKKKWI